MPYEEFTALAASLAPRVNLFRDVWAQAPDAEFFGGTSRDYLYWLKGCFKDAHDREDVDRIVAELHTRPFIDVRDFIKPASDVDVIAAGSSRVNAADYAVRKIDHIDLTRFDPNTDRGRTELHQGYIPVEKIRIGRAGVCAPEAFGDGAREIYSGDLTIEFAPPEQFAETYFAKQGQNHPVLLALRFIRLLATDYYYVHGAGAPDKRRLGNIPDLLSDQIRATIHRAVTDPNLNQLLKNKDFVRRMNDTVHKAFRSHTNPSAAMALYLRYGADMLVRTHEELDPINQYLLAVTHDPVNVAAHLAEFETSAEKLHSAHGAYFPDGRLYHGTRTEEAFRNILQVGFLPSVTGSAGRGLYGVGQGNIAFASEWAKSADRVLSFDVKPSAVLVDVTQGEGARVYAAYKRKYGGDHDTFAAFVGADVLRYEYAATTAFVIKNHEALSRPQGLTRQILSAGAFLKRAPTVDTLEKLAAFARSMGVNALRADEQRLIFERVPALRTLDDAPDSPETRASFLAYYRARWSDPAAIREAIAQSHSAVLRRRLATVEAFEPAVDAVKLLELSGAAEVGDDAGVAEAFREITIAMAWRDHTHNPEFDPARTLPGSARLLAFTALLRELDAPAVKHILKSAVAREGEMLRRARNTWFHSTKDGLEYSALTMLPATLGGMGFDHILAAPFPLFSLAGLALGGLLFHVARGELVSDFRFQRILGTIARKTADGGEDHDLDFSALKLLDGVLRASLHSKGAKKIPRRPLRPFDSTCKAVMGLLFGAP